MILTDYCMDVQLLPLFEDSIRAVLPKADPHGARRQARDRLLVRRPIILSLGSYPVVTRVFILY
jgi:hypothetical protein